jgi:single-stranded-DNA-specific exonuclease
MHSSTAFLGVERSITGQAWFARLDVRGEAVAERLAQDQIASPILARILIGRDVLPDNATRYLNPTLRDLLPDPARFTDMDRAARRIADAIITGDKIAVFGDYDVDGAASSALIARYCAHFGMTTEIYIPDRIFEGYGPNVEAMQQLAARASLIITVDCGTNSAGPIAAAKAAGADVVVLDHHQQGGALPENVPVVNPNREDDLSGEGHLCAAGVVFVTLVAVSALLRAEGRKPPDLLSMLDIVALATIADVVPLKGVNRAFVVKGLSVARAGANAGIAALTKVSRIGEPLNPYHLGFMIGPRINAGGRIGDAALGARLLVTTDTIEADKIAMELDALNAERQAIEAGMLVQALEEAEAEMARGDGPPVLIAAHDKWHPGVAGILASRLKERFQRPAFAIAFNMSGNGTGSGRSIPGFDLGKLVRSAVDAGLLIKGGGHAMAAGITMEKAKLGELRAFFEENAAKAVAQLASDRALIIDGALSAEGVQLALIDDLDHAGPYGTGNPAPMFVLPHHKIAHAQFFGAGHLRVTLASQRGVQMKSVIFRAEGTPLGDFMMKSIGLTVHVAGTITRNHWQGKVTAEFRIVDAATAK